MQESVVIVHSLEQAKAALAATGHTPVTLQSAPGAAGYAGSLYLKTMFDAASEAYPQAKARFVIDCGDDAGLALATLRSGHKALHVSLEEKTYRKLTSIAAQVGATLTNA